MKGISSQCKAPPMKYLITILLFAICDIGQAQQTVLTNDPAIAIPKLSFDEKGELKITASATSSPNDFDFLVGQWKMHNRHLNKRLESARTGRSSTPPMRIPKSSATPPIWTRIPPPNHQHRKASS